MQTLRLIAPLALASLATAQNAFLVDSNLDQLFLVDVSTGAATMLASTANNGLGTPADLSFRAVTNELWTIDLAGGEVGTIDVATGTFTPVYQTNLSGWQGMAWDETAQMFYLANQNGDTYVLDPATGLTTLIGSSGFALITCLDTDASGNLFGIDFFTGFVVSVDKTTGVATQLSTTIAGFQGLGIDQLTGAWIGANTNDDSIHVIDPATGVSVLIGANGAGVVFAKGFDLIDVTGGTPAVNSSYGTACGGLSLSGLTRPITGTNWNLGLANVPAAATVAAVLLGLGNPNLPLGPAAPGCTQYSGDIGFVLVLLPIPSPAISLAIPNDPSYVGVSLSAQGAALVPGANPLGVSLSAGLRGDIGDV